ncbi:MAG: SRPBCC domain-containing protein [Planctomycetia bacterium]|nr:SRPBCC domain-containing protein [Planctomycetia bacterium]
MSTKQDSASDREIVITRVFNAPRELVWKVWTQPEHIAKWWGPRGFDTRVTTMDLRPGGKWHYVMRAPDGAEYPACGVFREVVPFERIVATDEFGEDFKPPVGMDLPQGMVTTAIFEDDCGNTRLTLRISHPTVEDRKKHEAMGVLGGWQSSFDCMDDYLDALQGESAIRQLIADQMKAICAKDVDRLMAPYAAEFVAFDAIPPFQTRGPDAWRQTWSSCLPHFPAVFQIETRDLTLAVSGDTGFAHWLFRFTGPDKDHPAMQSWMRLTGCYRKIGGKWQIVHEHCSVPFDPHTNKALLTLDV